MTRQKPLIYGGQGRSAQQLRDDSGAVIGMLAAAVCGLLFGMLIQWLL